MTFIISWIFCPIQKIRGGSGHYYSFSLFEYAKGSILSPFKIIFEEDLGYHGWSELINNRIILHGSDKTYTLYFRNNNFELTE
jgi:hypothetical protein